jgi:drug/metabolite transporter (DMT)-like permease
MYVSVRSSFYTRLHPYKAIAFMAFAVFLYAVSNVLVKRLAHIPSMEVVFFRSVVSLSLSLSMLRYNQLPPLGSNKWFLLTRGLLSAWALILSYAAIPFLPLTTIAVIGYLTPVLTAILAHFFLKEKVHPLQWFLFMFSFSGILIVKGFDPQLAIGPFVLLLLGLLFSAAGYITVRKKRTSEHPLTIVCYTSVLAMVFSGAYCLKSTSFTSTYTPSDWLFLLMTGMLTQVAQLLMTKAYQLEDAAKITNINYTSIIYALLFSYYLFDEVPQGYTWLGIGIVMTGVVLNMHFERLRRFLRSLYIFRCNPK